MDWRKEGILSNPMVGPATRMWLAGVNPKNNVSDLFGYMPNFNLGFVDRSNGMPVLKPYMRNATPEIMYDSPIMKLLTGGISSQTMGRLKSDAGWTNEDFAPYTPPEPPKPQPLGNDPTKQVTQQQYDQMLKEQKRKQEEKYLRYKQGKSR